MITAILMMAGNASRMQMNENKVYLPLGKQKIFEYSLNLFLDMGFEVICVIREEDRNQLDPYKKRVKIAIGGKTRQESVYKGLQEATGEYVLIHDAARPFVSQDLILGCCEAFEENCACLVATPSKDSLYLKTPLGGLNRDNVVLAQTPQGAKTKVMLECHQKAKAEGYVGTDDISLFIRYSKEMVKIIAGNDKNFKITTQLDYIIAKELMKDA